MAHGSLEFGADLNYINTVRVNDLPKNYEAGQVETEISQLWLEADLFAAVPDARMDRYVVMMPLPNVTGALHMGHAMDNVMQDLLVRWHRMRGFNALWMPGTDHAGIATQAVVEKRLKELEGLTRHDLGRTGLIDRIWSWKDQYQQRIVAQQRRMGCSCDWQRQRFTMDAVCARAVRHAFFRLFEDGLIFRGKRMVNWDVFLQTSVSDDEVYRETVKGSFWHLRYPVVEPQAGEPDSVIVATTRPETMLGDTAVAVHPDPAAALERHKEQLISERDRAAEKRRGEFDDALAALDERRRTLLPQLEKLRDMAREGRHVTLPLSDRIIPLICDEWAKPELGSGCVKITPAHDPNDYDVWTRHKDAIDILNILNPDGTLNEVAGSYAGLERYDARKKVVADLDAQGLLDRVEDRDVEIGHSDRSKTPVEPYLSDQWFLFMGDREGGVVMGEGTAKQHNSSGLVQAAMDAVSDGRVAIHPNRYTKTYLDWLAEKRDWPISRQLWWGHQIPVWSRDVTWGEAGLAELASVLGEGASFYVQVGEQRFAAPGGKLEGAAPADGDSVRIDVCLIEDDERSVAEIEGQGYVRDPDVLDTWFSSALWPFSTLGWPNPEDAPVDEGQRSLAAQNGDADCLSYYYPGSCLVTGRDIITLWVARMVLAGLYTQGDVPFSDVFIHANILDGKGERMSKSKGNGIDPVDIIERYGTDAMRYVLCDMQTGTQDIRLPVTAICPSCEHHNDLAKIKHGQSIFTYVCSKCSTEFDVLGTMPDLPTTTLISDRFDSGRAFCTKLWNSARFALMNLDGADEATDPLSMDQLELEDRWILDGLSQAIARVSEALAAYNPSQAMSAAREFFWSSLCDWYLELIKPRLAKQGEPTRKVAQRVLAFCIDQVLRLLQPMVPFITEHLWQRLGDIWPDRNLGIADAPSSKFLAAAPWPTPFESLEDAELRGAFSELQEIIRAVRDARASAGLSPKQKVDVTLKPDASRAAELESHVRIVVALANIDKLTIDSSAERPAGSANAIAGSTTIFVHGVIDEGAERKRLDQQLAKITTEIQKCEKKLANPKFAEKAPAHVVDEQRARLADYQRQRDAIEASLAQLN